MDFWPEYLARSWGSEFVAGGIGGTAGIVSGYPLDGGKEEMGENQFAREPRIVLSKAFCTSVSSNDPPSLKGVALGGVGTSAFQSLLLSPVELVKIRLQLQSTGQSSASEKGPVKVAKNIWKNEGLRRIYRGLDITMLRDAPAYGLYFILLDL
ncbi:unnamed protein product [Lupinus luteus]|uniref:Uncharacterized protein n=1 Tax=Lupinus luteus TaxID=3873 RepID=A0AAV1XK54_LUPLU